MAHSPIKALSVAQPWAWALIAGIKKVENRTWHTPYQGRLVIHASKSLGYLNRYSEEEWREMLPGYPGRDKLDYGAFVGSLWLVGSFEGLGMGRSVDPRFAEGPYCWVVRDAQALPAPIMGKGSLGLFAPPQVVLDAAGLSFDMEAATREAAVREGQRLAAMKGGAR